VSSFWPVAEGCGACWTPSQGLISVAGSSGGCGTVSIAATALALQFGSSLTHSTLFSWATPDCEHAVSMAGLLKSDSSDGEVQVVPSELTGEMISIIAVG
jgi:hypothetical protein